jgi:hypothetical protein
MFKENNNLLYFWYVDKKLAVLHNVCLKSHILKTILKIDVINIQAIIWSHDYKLMHYDSE